MRRLLFALAFAVLFLSVISATPLNDLLSENTTHINITISQNYSQASFYLNTSGYSWDTQDINYNGLQIQNFPISTFLSGINYNVSMQPNNYPKFNYFLIQPASLTSLLTDNILNYLNFTFDSSDLNNNYSILDSYIKELPKPNYDISANLSKSGDNHEFYINKGYGNVPGNYKNEIADIVSRSVIMMNIKSELNTVFPFNYTIPLYILNELDYNVSVNLTDFNLSNGDYSITVQATNGNQTYQKAVFITLEDIVFNNETQTNETNQTNPQPNPLQNTGSGGVSPHKQTKIPIIIGNDTSNPPKQNVPNNEGTQKPIVNVNPESPEPDHTSDYIIALCLFVLLIAVVIIVLKKSKVNTVERRDEEMEEESEETEDTEEDSSDED